MAPISLRVHNILDYIVGAVLLLCPSLFGFSDIDTARNVFLTLGFGLIGYSLLTRYRYSVLKVIPIGLHMAMDVAAGVFAILAPYLLNYRGLLTGGQLAVHFVMGMGAIGLVILTRSRTEDVAAVRDPDEVPEVTSHRRAA